MLQFQSWLRCSHQETWRSFHESHVAGGSDDVGSDLVLCVSMKTVISKSKSTYNRERRPAGLAGSVLSSCTSVRTVCKLTYHVEIQQNWSRKLSLPDVAGGRGRSIVPIVRSSQSTGKGVQRGSEVTERNTKWDSPLCQCSRRSSTSPDDGNSWINRTRRGRDGVAARVSQEALFGTGRGSFPRDVEHSQDPPERGTSTHSGTIQDVRTRSCSPRGCTEHYQTGTHSAQSSPTPQGHRAGRPSTADEQRAENSERRKKVEGKYA